jgi:hypothetical protein
MRGNRGKGKKTSTDSLRHGRDASTASSDTTSSRKSLTRSPTISKRLPESDQAIRGLVDDTERAASAAIAHRKIPGKSKSMSALPRLFPRPDSRSSSSCGPSDRPFPRIDSQAPISQEENRRAMPPHLQMANFRSVYPQMDFDDNTHSPGSPSDFVRGYVFDPVMSRMTGDMQQISVDPGGQMTHSPVSCTPLHFRYPGVDVRSDNEGLDGYILPPYLVRDAHSRHC